MRWKDPSIYTRTHPPIKIISSKFCLPVFCDFEADDLCGFEQSQGDSFDWVRGTSNDHASLPLDHSTNNASGGCFFFYLFPFDFLFSNEVWWIFTPHFHFGVWVLSFWALKTDRFDGSKYTHTTIYSYPECKIAFVTQKKLSLTIKSRFIIFPLPGHYMYADTSVWGVGAFTSLFSPRIYDLPEACVAFMYFSTRLDQLEAWLHTEENPDPVSIANFSAPFNGWSGAR